jgi:acyl carrier protein
MPEETAMNEDISRILQMLEEGKINAAEAERLIRALKEPGAPSAEAGERPTPRPGPVHDFNDLIRLIAQATKRAARRQRRLMIWRFFQFLRCQEEFRQERARTMNVEERVRFVLQHIAVVETDEIEPASRLRADLKMGPIAFDNLRSGLEVEFHMEIPPGDLSGLDTVQAVVDYISRRLSPPEEATQGHGDAETRESGDAKKRGKSAKPVSSPNDPTPNA